MHSKRYLALLCMLSCTAEATPGHPSPAAGAIQWGACARTPSSDVDQALFARLDCGWIAVPYDRDVAGSPIIEIPILRVRAARARTARGTIFYHPGGPGVDPTTGVIKLAQQWRAIDPNDADQGDLRRLGDNYDLVSVVPRGFTEETRLDCPWFDARSASQAMLDPDNDAKWRRMVDDATAFARSCGPHARHAGTEAAVEDFEAVRKAMNVDKVHFYGVSYGTWVATWYAARHPEHTGRVLLDASLDFRHQWPFQTSGLHIYRERALIDDGLKPAAAHPEIYGLGKDTQDIRRRLMEMPLFMRRMWAPAVSFPEHVVGALAVADEWKSLPVSERTHDRLRGKLMTRQFHTQGDIDAGLRQEAFDLLGALFDERDKRNALPYAIPGNVLAVYCNDSVWDVAPHDIRRTLRFGDGQFSFPRGQDTVMGVLCSAWPHPPKPRPSFASLQSIPSIMMIHASSDWTTPLGGAMAMAERLPNSRLVVTRGLQAHNTLGHPMAQCATRQASHYLLTGETPVERRVECMQGESSVSPHTHDPQEL